MRKGLLLLVVLALMCSCSSDKTGTVRLSADSSRGISAYIEYPSLLDKTWTLSAEKVDGARTGEGQYENIVLTDELGPFSTGQWRFTITDSENKITGTKLQTINAGTNTVSITVHSTASKGILSVENCNLLLSRTGDVSYVDLYIDNERINTSWVISQIASDDGDYYELPTVTETLSEGIHTVRLYYATPSGGVSSDTVSVRIVKGMTTHFSIGEHEGNLAISVSFDTQEAIIY